MEPVLTARRLAKGARLGLVLIDQDGVLADFERGLLDAFRAEYPGAPFIDLPARRGFYARRQYAATYGPEWGRMVDAVSHAEGFFLSLPVIPGALEAVREMREAGHEVFVCTSPLTGSQWCVPEKLGWIESHLDRSWLDRVIVIKDKTLVGDRLQRCVLVDDRPRITGSANPPPWTHVLYDAPYNQAEPGPRLSCWAEWHDVLTPYLDDQQR